MLNHAHPLHKGHHEFTEKTDRKTQEKRVFDAMYRRPVTMLMAAHSTGVERANSCRIVDRLRKRGMIWLLYKLPCEISKDRAGYYTTDRHKALKIREHLNSVQP
jgi:hypothetical protein